MLKPACDSVQTALLAITCLTSNGPTVQLLVVVIVCVSIQQQQTTMALGCSIRNTSFLIYKSRKIIYNCIRYSYCKCIIALRSANSSSDRSTRSNHSIESCASALKASKRETSTRLTPRVLRRGPLKRSKVLCAAYPHIIHTKILCPRRQYPDQPSKPTNQFRIRESCRQGNLPD